MGKIYTKRIHGRDYLYERISVKRVGDKVVTKDKYRGAVKPVQGQLDDMSKSHKDKMKMYWLSFRSDSMMIAAVDTFTGRTYAASTIRKWCAKTFGKRRKVGKK